MANRIWTYEKCYEAAKQFTCRSEFAYNNNPAYKASFKKGWINDYNWFVEKQKPRGYWTYNNCYKAAKECTSKVDMYNKYPTAYERAKKNMWFDDYTWFVKDVNPYSDVDNVYAYFFNKQHAVYIGRTINLSSRNTEHHTRGTVFNFATENNIDIPEMIVLESGFNVLVGLEKEDYYVNKYKSEGWNVINKAKTGKQSGSLGGIIHKLSYEKCYNIAKQYSNIRDFRKNSNNVYSKSHKMGWIKDYTWFEPLKKPNGYWDYNRCYEVAKDCNSRTEMKTTNSSAYNVAKDNKWLDDYTWFKAKRKAA